MKNDQKLSDEFIKEFLSKNEEVAEIFDFARRAEKIFAEEWQKQQEEWQKQQKD
jgi:hypothetical protein